MTWYSILKQERVKIVASIYPINYRLVLTDIATILRNYTPEYGEVIKPKKQIAEQSEEVARRREAGEITDEEASAQAADVMQEGTGRIERDSYPEAQIEMLAEVEEHLDEFKDILSNLVFRTEKVQKKEESKIFLKPLLLSLNSVNRMKRLEKELSKPKEVLESEKQLKGPLTKSVSNFQKQNPNQ